MKQFETTIIALTILILAGCSVRPSGVEGEQSIDSRLVGGWYLEEHSRMSGIPPIVDYFVDIDASGNLHGLGTNYRDGTIQPLRELPRIFAERRFLWAEDGQAEIIEYKRSRMNIELTKNAFDVEYSFTGDSLLIRVEDNGWYRNSEVYTKIEIGQKVLEPVHYDALLIANGDTLRPDDIAVMRPAFVRYMKLDTAVHLSVIIRGPMQDSGLFHTAARVYNYSGLKSYPTDTTQRYTGHISRISPSGDIMTSNAASTGSVTIKLLDLAKRRCKGSFKILFRGKRGFREAGPPLQTTCTFDLPVIIDNEFDIKRYGIGGKSVPKFNP